MQARVHSLHTKPRTAGEHGLPKPEVFESEVTELGFEADYNHYRQSKHAGTRDRAVLVLSLETMHTLASEGWPVSPGDLGENVTLEHFAYDRLVVGDRIAVGDELLLEITEACQPCKNLEVLPYVGKEKITAFMKTLLGRRGWYARVIRPGHARKGDRTHLASR